MKRGLVPDGPELESVQLKVEQMMAFYEGNWNAQRYQSDSVGSHDPAESMADRLRDIARLKEQQNELFRLDALRVSREG